MISIFIDYINIVFSGVGIPTILSLTDLTSVIMSTTGWWQMLRPDVLISCYCYCGVAYAFYWTICILPFRAFKRLLKFDNKKGK